MTVSVDKNYINLVADGVHTDFVFDFVVHESSHVVIYFDSAISTAPYTVVGLGNPAGGIVAFADPPEAGTKVSIYRVVPVTQETRYRTYGRFPGPTFELDLDKSTLIDQQLREQMSRGLVVPPGTGPDVSGVLPAPESLHFIRWNAAATEFENVDGTVDFVNALFTETLSLANGQTLAQFTHPVEKAGFTVNGPNTDNGRLLPALDYSVNAQTRQVTLTQSYPAGTQLTMTYVGSIAAGGGFTVDDRIKLDYLAITRPFDADDDQDGQVVLEYKLQSTNYMVGDPTSPDLNLQTDHVSVSTPVRMETEQVLPVDLHEAIASLELATIGTVVQALAARVFHFSKAIDVLDIPDTWTEIVQLRELVSSGTYMLGFSVLWEYDQASQSVDMRYSIDGGVTWTEAHMEPKDSTDVTATTYQFPMTLVDGTHGMIIQMKKETTSGIFNVRFADTWLERKGEY